MYGAVIGDIVGSVYEWNNIHNKDFLLFNERGGFTDDTVLTMATAEWVMDGGNPEDYLLKWGRLYDGLNDFGKGWFGKGFREWVANPGRQPYKADTNGAVMRISPVPFLIRDTNQALEKAMEFTMVTHNHPDSIRAVRAYVTVMHDIFDGMDSRDIKKHIAQDFCYDMERPVGSLQYKKFIYSCNGTVPQAMICALDASSFEDALRNAVSLGGDSDTLACMAGALAEARFGVPKDVGNKALEYLDNNVLGVLKKMYKLVPQKQDYFLKRDMDSGRS